ncbi:hypothetical protein CSKR_104237 [Clonorchis sinensis]|uniref:Uncharacterized protein n=1 Tax=Clonorchis sinensis TaxID=79923 RepID=A0A3R7DGD0_CLOSI|nr:hypothetical protein CSKR_104237 [Clonorchis sinensis]
MDRSGHVGARRPKWLERELTDRKVRGSNPTSASRLPLSRLGQPGSIPALVQPSGGMAVRHRKGATAERRRRWYSSDHVHLWSLVTGSFGRMKFMYRSCSGVPSFRSNNLTFSSLSNLEKSVLNVSSNCLNQESKFVHIKTTTKGAQDILTPNVKNNCTALPTHSVGGADSGNSGAFWVRHWQLLEYADDLIPVFEEQEKAQFFLDELTKVFPSCGMHFAPTKCKAIQSLDTPLTIQGEALELERFTYLGSCISSAYSVTDKFDARIFKARVLFANLRYVWRQSCISLNLKGCVHQATVRNVLYGFETWSVRAAELRALRYSATVASEP